MRQRNSYSRIIHDMADWNQVSKGTRIQLFHHCIEKDITSFLINTTSGSYDNSMGTAFSESGLSRDKIQFIAAIEDVEDEEKVIAQVDKILEILDGDYLDLLLLDVDMPANVLLSIIKRLRVKGKIVEIGVLEKKLGDKKAFLEDFPASATLSGFKFTPAAIKTFTLTSTGPQETTQMLSLESGEWENEHEELRKMAEKYDLQPKELLFSWLLQHEGYFHPVIKGNSEAVIDSAVKSFHTRLIDEDLKKLPEKL